MSIVESYTAIVIFLTIVIIILNQINEAFIKAYEFYFVGFIVIFVFVIPIAIILYTFMFKEKKKYFK